MGALDIAIAFWVRLLLVLLFLPFSALDKILDFRGATAQAQQETGSPLFAMALIVIGCCIEIFMSLGVLTGIADRLAALILALYCIATAVLWKQFWKPGDFWTKPDGKARALFWDFWKNLALAGGFLLITFGTGAGTVRQFFAHPLASTHPYALSAQIDSAAR